MHQAIKIYLKGRADLLVYTECLVSLWNVTPQAEVWQQWAPASAAVLGEQLYGGRHG